MTAARAIPAKSVRVDPRARQRLGTVAGVILVTLLQSILSVMQIEEYGRHVIYGGVIVAMLLVCGRGRRHSE